MGSACACYDKNEEAANTINESSSSGDGKKVAFPDSSQEQPQEEPEVQHGKFTMVLHSAKINRSFAKFGHMDPYAIIDVDDKEVGRSKPDKSAHKEPHWESSFSWEADGIPKNIHIAVWDKNDFHRDVFIGAVTFPCSVDMGKHEDLCLSLTKKSEATGTINLSLEAVSLGPASTEIKRTVTIGGEFDHVAAHFNGDGKKGDKTVQLGESESHRKKSSIGEEGQEEVSKQATKLSPEESGSSVGPLLGSWKCVDTHGLDAFLKATGVGVFQRKIANAAKWPAWDFRLQGTDVMFVNHSAIGDLTEVFPLDKDYDWKDGHGNPMTCRAVWTPSADGGVLTTERKGTIGNYSESRTVTGDRLEFSLKHATGVEWGRAFVREG